VLAGCAALMAGCTPVLPGPGPGNSSKTVRVAPPCRASQLRPNLFLQGATGKLLGGIDFRIVGSQPCSLFFGPPQVSLSGTHARYSVYTMRPVGRGGDARPVRNLRSLRPGDRVVVDLSWSNWCGQPPKALVVTVPFGGGTFRLRPPGTPRCDVESQPSRLGVGPIVPVR
jgi:hypothetical protein